MAPTLAQQRAFALAPIPFAAVSFLSSGCVVHYLLFRERQNLRRLYHRLVLGMNAALLPLSLAYAWSTFAVPEGTPGYVGASGTVNTCTAQGFISLMFTMTVPVYYVSLSVQAFMGVANSFEEEKYRWIEKYIHFAAWVVPAALCTVVAATENFNPGGSKCAMTKAPFGCQDDPDVPCVRGRDIDRFESIVGLGIASLYLVFPPSITISMYCWIKKLKNKAGESRGMQKLREKAREQMMHQIAMQISLYLFSFWLTFAPGTVLMAHHIATGKIWYNMSIFASCLVALQGFIMAAVYFALQRLGTPRVEVMPTPSRRGSDRQTIRDIRASALRESAIDPEDTEPVEEDFSFNIFDGTPDADSPWARYFDEEDDGDDLERSKHDGDERTPDEDGSQERHNDQEDDDGDNPERNKCEGGTPNGDCETAESSCEELN